MKPYRKKLIVCLLAIFALGTAWSQDEPYPNVPWTDLFSGNNKELKGWAPAKDSGKALLEIKEGSITRQRA